MENVNRFAHMHTCVCVCFSYNLTICGYNYEANFRLYLTDYNEPVTLLSPFYKLYAVHIILHQFESYNIIIFYLALHSSVK